MSAHSLPYRLGLPAWSFPGWRGRYFAAQPRALSSYERVFNTVEGNTTFYGTPTARTVQAWHEAVAGTDFEFCFKLPRTVTHGHTADMLELEKFMRAILPLGKHLGPLLVQFPAWVDPERLHVLERLFDRLPPDQRYVVEVRHPRFFTEPSLLEPLLDRYGLGRVILDTRALHAGDRHHPEVTAARHEKPKLPVLPRIYNELAFLRLVLHPEPRYNNRYIREWAVRVTEYIAAGWATYVLIHCPNNLHCPQFAVEFHRAMMAVSTTPGLRALPSWPVPRQARLI